VFGGYARFRVRAGQVVIVRAGTSFTSPEAASRNLEAEIGSVGFDVVRSRAESAWEDALGRVRARGGSNDERQVFYTALYHAFLQPRLFSDADGSYRDSGWRDGRAGDRIRSLRRLLALGHLPRPAPAARAAPAGAGAAPRALAPRQGRPGRLPAELLHGASVIADARVKGGRGFEGEAALRALVKNATQTPPYEEYADGKGRRALADYVSLGYIPLEQEVKRAAVRHEPDLPAVRSKSEMQAQRLVELCQEGRRELAHPAADPLDRDGSDLLRLSLRIARQPALRRREKHLKRIHSTHVRGDRYEGDDAPVEVYRRGIGPIVADDHRRPSLVRLRAARRIEIDNPDLSSQHQRAGSIPSPATASQASASPPVAHSSQACA